MHFQLAASGLIDRKKLIPSARALPSGRARISAAPRQRFTRRRPHAFIVSRPPRWSATCLFFAGPQRQFAFAFVGARKRRRESGRDHHHGGKRRMKVLEARENGKWPTAKGLTFGLLASQPFHSSSAARYGYATQWLAGGSASGAAAVGRATRRADGARLGAESILD